MNKDISKILRDIRQLKIQGATNVAISSLEAFKIAILNSRARTKKSFYSKLFELSNAFYKVRPTEPMMRNEIHSLMVLAYKFVKSKKDLEEMKEKLLHKINRELINIKRGREKIIENGANLIKKHSTVLTICHSSTVVDILIHANNEQNKNIDVISLETRPLYQGRKTALELAKSDIDVLSVVDNAANTYLKYVDLVLVGADAITSTGDLINKIGTSGLAILSNEQGIPFYSAATLLKFDFSTLYGHHERIERRSPKEVWNIKQENLRIQNFAFDKTHAKYISGYITELGVLPPQAMLYFAKSYLKGAMDEEK